MRIGEKGARSEKVYATNIDDHARKFGNDAGKGDAGKDRQNASLPEKHRRVKPDRKRKKKLNYSEERRKRGTDNEPFRKPFPGGSLLKNRKRHEEERGEGKKKSEFPNSPKSVFREEERERGEKKKRNEKSRLDAGRKKKLPSEERMDYPEAGEPDGEESGNMEIDSGRRTQCKLEGKRGKEEDEEEGHEKWQ